MRRSVLCCALLLAVSGVTGCVAGQDIGGKPLAAMSFSYVEPILVNAGAVQVVNKYDASQTGNAADALPTPPDLALRRYAENRLKAVGVDNKLFFVIEDAYVRKSLLDPANRFMKWTGVDNSDKFDMHVVIRLYYQDANGAQGSHSVLTFDRSVTIPHHFNLSQKELEKLKFMEMFMKDVDEAVEGLIIKRGWLSRQSVLPRAEAF